MVVADQTTRIKLIDGHGCYRSNFPTRGVGLSITVHSFMPAGEANKNFMFVKSLCRVNLIDDYSILGQPGFRDCPLEVSIEMSKP